MFQRKLLALVLSLALPNIASASRFRADDPEGFPLLNAAPAVSEESKEKPAVAPINAPLAIFYKDGARIISESDMENLKRFAEGNAGQMFLVSVFYSNDRTLGLERLRGIKRALVALGTDGANIMLMPIKDEAKDGMAELKVLPE